MSTTATLFDAAIELIRRGLPIVVCSGKIPLGGKEWHKLVVTEDNLPELLQQARNPAIGIKLGPSSVIDIEADGETEEQLFAALFAGYEPPITPTYKSTRGKHRLFRFDDKFTGTNRGIINFRNGGPHKLEIRIGADGKAAQSVIPPSSGREWLVSWDDCEPAALPDAVVNRILAAVKPKPSATSTNGTATGRVVERARKYIAKIPGAVSGQSGHDVTFHVSCVLVLGFALDRESALKLLREWNEHCEPPWSEGEMQHKIDDADKQPGERGYLLNGDRDAAPDLIIRKMTDMGNAERFAEQHGIVVRFCHPWGKWLAWNNMRWKLDATGELIRRAKLTARRIYVEASKAPDSETAKSLAKWAATSERRERLAAMLALAESEQPIPIAVEQLDSQPWLLNCENGTIDLRTGELREHRREDYLTKLAPVEFPTESGDDPELWLSFLNRIFAQNKPLIRFVQQLMGMSLVGEVIEHLLPILWGTGANGKSVLIETWCGMLGPDYAMKAPTNFLMAAKGERHPTELADLHGIRLVAVVESSNSGRLSETLVKELTGGDSIRARRMREDFWQFRPSHLAVLATNHKPIVRGTDHGVWRRIRLVPFTVTIPESEQDKQLTQKLRSEWPAILRWAVTGCLDWQHNGLHAPDEVLKATGTYRADMDTLGEFLEDRCIIGDGYEARAGDLYSAYKKWAEDRSEYIETQTMFGTRLTERGFEKGRDSGNRVVYRGIGLLVSG